MSQPSSVSNIGMSKAQPWRNDRDLRAFLEAYDLRNYAREMQQLIEHGLPTIGSPAESVQSVAQGASTAARAAEIVAQVAAVQVAEIAARLNQAIPAASSTVAAPTGLPRPATLVGRDRELAVLAAGLRSGSSVGVFSIEGMGGIGKSALAAEAAARLAEDRDTFPGGAIWVTCEGLTGDEGLAELWARVARALGLEQVAAQADPAARRAALGQALAQRPRTLLALDNIEPGLDARAAIETLAVASHTAVLLTARHAVAPEKLRPMLLHPLEEPDAATLFAQRLRQSDAARPNAEDDLQIPAVVEAVGGLPLAIELMAAYAGQQRLPLDHIVAQLAEDHLDAAAFRADPARTLTARFDRNWQVLSATERLLFAGLSLLAGPSFPREVAVAIASAAPDLKRAPDQGERADPEGDVAALVSYALVEPLAGERVRLHPLLREYAANRLRALGSGVEERLGDAMVAYWLNYAESHPGYEGMDALEAEAPGLTGALQWAHDHARPRDVLALAKLVGRTWDIRGRRDEELRIDQWADDAARQLGDLAEQRWAADSMAITLGRIGRLPEARSCYERALQLAHELRDMAAERAELHGLATLNSWTGRLAEARAGFERALELARQLGDPAAEQAEVHELAVLDSKTGRLEEARAGFERALALARQLSDPAAERAEVHSLAVLDVDTGRLQEARAGYERALELARELGDPAAEAVELRNLGIFIAQQQFEPAGGRAYITQALAIYESLGDIYAIAKCHEFLGRLDWQESDTLASTAHYREALRLFVEVQSPDAEDVRVQLRHLGVDPDEGEV